MLTRSVLSLYNCYVNSVNTVIDIMQSLFIRRKITAESSNQLGCGTAERKELSVASLCIY